MQQTRFFSSYVAERALATEKKVEKEAIDFVCFDLTLLIVTLCAHAVSDIVSYVPCQPTIVTFGMRTRFLRQKN